MATFHKLPPPARVHAEHPKNACPGLYRRVVATLEAADEAEMAGAHHLAEELIEAARVALAQAGKAA